ncbi:thioredoxin domain-containing protein [Candidatus Nomurabacteria bacterium]|nr:thioredoxin domain-containing protein [Candidatus Nomurabacteria bacterium]
MAENQLSPKEQYEQEQKLKRAERGGAGVRPVASGSGRGIWPWILAILILGGTVFGLYKLATVTPPGGVPSDGALSIPVTEADWLDGNLDAKVQLVEYSDFQCPACAFYAPWIKQLRDEFADEQLVVVYRHFPLRTIHANAQISSQVVEAAGLQGKFWLAADIIFDNQKLWSEQILARQTLVKLLQPLGLNLSKLEQDIDSAMVKKAVEQDLQSGVSSGVDSTPSFFLNGKRINNPQSYEEFKKLITDNLGA